SGTTRTTDAQWGILNSTSVPAGNHLLRPANPSRRKVSQTLVTCKPRQDWDPRQQLSVQPLGLSAFRQVGVQRRYHKEVRTSRPVRKMPARSLGLSLQ